MFHDGRNPRRGLQESHATGARNDFPELDYDFGAPLAIDGDLREKLVPPAPAAQPAPFVR